MIPSKQDTSSHAAKAEHSTSSTANPNIEARGVPRLARPGHLGGTGAAEVKPRVCIDCQVGPARRRYLCHRCYMRHWHRKRNNPDTWDGWSIRPRRAGRGSPRALLWWARASVGPSYRSCRDLPILWVETVRRTLTSLAISAGLVIALWWPGTRTDFVFDWLITKAFVSGVDPYLTMGEIASRFDLNHFGFDHIAPRTPATLLFQAPIGFVPFEWSYIVGRLLTVASAFGLALVVARLARRDWLWFIALTPAVLLIWPFSATLRSSQTAFLVAALIGVTWLMGDRWRAGLPLALAVSIKLWPWLLIPGLWLSGRRKAAYGAVGWFAGLNLVGLAFPNVTIEGLGRMLADADGVVSRSPWTFPPWVLAVMALLVLIVASRWVDPFRWATPIALLFAPVLWAAYLPALVIVWRPRSGQVVDTQILEGSVGFVSPSTPAGDEHSVVGRGAYPPGQISHRVDPRDPIHAEKGLPGS